MPLTIAANGETATVLVIGLVMEIVQLHVERVLTSEAIISPSPSKRMVKNVHTLKVKHAKMNVCWIFVPYWDARTPMLETTIHGQLRMMGTANSVLRQNVVATSLMSQTHARTSCCNIQNGIVASVKLVPMRADA
jgi:hypothetical protein